MRNGYANLVKGRPAPGSILGDEFVGIAVAGALSLLGSGKVDLLPVISHCKAFADLPRAFELQSRSAAAAIKVMIDCRGAG